MADRKLVAHLLRRATFGPTPAEINSAATRDYADVVADLVKPSGIDPAASLPTFATDPYLKRNQLMTPQERMASRAMARDQLADLTQGWFARMTNAPDQFVEKMVFFWHGHWATSAEKVDSALLMRKQLATFRSLGLGDFAVLAKAMVRDPALILWLDGQQNTRRAPNENLARELMELFTLGVGSYTEKDVKGAARALTGWTLDRDTATSKFEPNRHARGDKKILGSTADYDADTLIDLLVRQPAHPVFLARRLWFRFGSSSVALPEPTRDRMVAAYGASRNITAMLTALLTDDQFMASPGHLVKQPVEWAVGAVRQLGIPQTDRNMDNLLRSIKEMAQIPLRPPSVGGWPSGTAWLTTSSLQVRMRAATDLADALPKETLSALSSSNKDTKINTLGRMLAIDEWTDRTRKVLTAAASKPQRLVTLALVSPEYAVH
jgi:uncharacterized protein (DUF1800 family)